jgi:hypothetical protein
VRWVEQTGGDDPQKAADLILRLLSEEAASINGQFLWIDGGLQEPIPSWATPSNQQLGARPDPSRSKKGVGIGGASIMLGACIPVLNSCQDFTLFSERSFTAPS